VPGNIKVATLTSTLEVVFKGAEAAKAAADTVARAEQLIEEAASSASAELRVQAREQDKLIDKLRELTSESKKSADGLTEADTTLKTLRESLRDVSEEAGRGGQMFSGYQDAIGVLEALRSTVSDLEGETGGAFLQATLLRNRIAEFESLPTGTDYSEWLKSVHEDTQRLLGDTDAMDRLAEGVQKVDDAAKVSEIDKTLVDIAKGSDEMAKKMSQGRREASLFDRVMSRLNATTPGFVRLLRSGNVGNALLAQGLVNVRRSAQGAEKGMAGLVRFLKPALWLLAAAGVFTLARALFGVLEPLRGIRPESVAAARALRDVGETDLSRTAAGLQVLENRLTGLGVSQPGNLLAEITDVADVLSRQVPGRGVLDTIRDIVQAVESGNPRALLDYGVNIEKVRMQIEALGPSATNAARAQIILEAATARANSTLEEASAAAADEGKRLATVGQEISGFLSDVANDPFVRDAINQLVEGLKALVIAAKPLIGILGAIAVALTGALGVALKVVAALWWALVGAVQVTVTVLDEAAKALGFQENVFGDARRAVGGYLEELGAAITGNEGATKSFLDTNSALADLEGGLQTAEERYADFRSAVQGGFGLVDSVTNLSDALRVMQDEMTPESAFNFFRSLDSTMTLVADGGIERLEALWQVAQQLFERGAIPPAAFEEIAGVVDATRLITQGLGFDIEGLIENLQGTETRGSSAVERLNMSFGTLDTGVANVITTVQELDATLRALPSQVVTEVIVTTSGGVTGVSGATGAQGGGTGGFNVLQGFANMFNNRVAPIVAANLDFFGRVGGALTPTATTAPSGPPGGVRMGPFTPSTGIAGEQAAIERRAQSLADQQAFEQTLANAFQRGISQGNMLNLLNFPLSNLSGGGGGRPEDNFDQIRQLIREVNRAINIGVRGGIRIGTAGNAVPFEMGTFLNPEGGGLTVDTILIRGIWDFADPASKRLIMRELRDALRLMESEV
jgi:hypothetical protein